jgi:hypothetical protein
MADPGGSAIRAPGMHRGCFLISAGLGFRVWMEPENRDDENVLLRVVGMMAGGLSGQEARPPALLVEGEDGGSSPLSVEDVEVRVLVTGNVAETVMTLRFRNDTDRVLGVLEFGE